MWKSVFLESSGDVCLTQMILKKRLSATSPHLFWNVIFSHVTVVIRKINPGKTLPKYGSLSNFDEFEARTIPTGTITIQHVMRKASSQNKGSPFKKNMFSPPPSSSPVFRVLWRQEMSLDIKVQGGSDSLPLLCVELSTTPDTWREHTHTHTHVRVQVHPPSHFVSILSHKP